MMTISYKVTRRALSLGSADAVTGYFAKQWTESTIDTILQPKGAVFTLYGVGYYSRYSLTGFTQDPIVEGDEIIDSASTYYEIKNVEPVYNGDAFIFYQCELSKIMPHADRPATYGTDLTVRDARSRTKTYLDTYITDANITADDNVTVVDNLVQWAMPDYPMSRIFSDKGIEVIYSIGTPTSQPLLDHDMKAYAYNESVPITISAINTATSTGAKLRWKAEAELRRVCETYPTGSQRGLERMRDSEKDLGSLRLYEVEYMMTYKRSKSV